MDIPDTIDCMYSCTVCGIVKAHVKVRLREEAENVVDWLQKVATPAFVADHERRSPDCRPTFFADVYIPISGAKFIGGPSVQ